MYRVIFSDSAEKDLAHFPKHYQKLIRDRIDILTENPRPHGTKKLLGRDAYRLRQWPYRILYQVDDSELLVVISQIKSGGEAYK